MTLSARTNATYRAGASVVLAAVAATSVATAAPAIRTADDNRVPACVSPDKLMTFLTERNRGVDPRYRDIARWYKYYGDAWHVRWDYAFFQMAIETNYLKFRQGNGRRGDVHERQNNFAGIGATGHGAPGDRFPDIKTGVHAQIQHLVAYSGEHLADPIAPRTQLKQDDIIEQSRRLRRRVTFGDLARRWAADRRYAKSIDFVANQFRSSYCTGTAAAELPPVPKPQPAQRNPRSLFPPPAGLGGPKPLKLAGPDDLPWANGAPSGAAPHVPAAPDAPAAVVPDRLETPASKAPRSAVRTIWSRNGRGDEPSEPVKGAKHAAKPTHRPAVVATQPPVAATPEPAASTTEPGVDAPPLPTFKISPVVQQPSRLGGPMRADTEAPATQPANGSRTPPGAGQGPSARFGDIIGAPAAPVPAAATGPCRVLTASYGGKKTLLVRTAFAGETRYTALTVLDGFEQSMFDIYTKASARPDASPAEIVGEYPTRDEALADARANCPGG